MTSWNQHSKLKEFQQKTTILKDKELPKYGVTLIQDLETGTLQATVEIL